MVISLELKACMVGHIATKSELGDGIVNHLTHLLLAIGRLSPPPEIEVVIIHGHSPQTQVQTS